MIKPLDPLSRIWADIQAARIDDLVDEIGATWWRAHKLAEGLGEPWAELDAELLSVSALARDTIRGLA